jgi:uncharacterized protein YhbP (UPF0306 family)
VQEVHRFLLRHNVLTLAYQDDSGPGACAVWFASREDLSIFFLSALTTRHGQALAGGQEVAFAVHKDDQDWRAIQGVQGRGRCQPVPQADQDAAWRAYIARFPFVAEQLPDLRAALARTVLWQVVPSWIRLIDNTRGFGFRQELDLSTGG